MSNNPEELKTGAERTVEASTSAERRAEELRSQERTVESPRDAEATAERLKQEAMESAVSREAGGAEKKRPSDSPARRRGGISKTEKKASYKKHMKDVQRELSPGSRAFSKVIHNPIVEKTSEVVGGTVARPNAVLAGAISAFILTLAVYVIARTIGYTLSGFETIAAFIIGWVIGIIYDYLRLIITGKK
jgi:hypothetical protein